MAPENDNDMAQTEQPGEAEIKKAPAKRARRKVTAAAAAPADSDQQSRPDAETEAEAPKRTRKAAAKKTTTRKKAAAAPEADALVPADLVTEPAETVAAVAEGGPEQAEAKPARRTRKAAKKAVAPEQAAPVEPVSPAEQITTAVAPGEDATAEVEPPKPAKRTRRKKTAEPVAPAAVEPVVAPEAPAEAESPVETEESDLDADVPVVAVVDGDALGEAAAEDAEDEPAEETPAFSFGVLFQAPDPTAARRRRRAGAPAGPAVPPEAAPVVVEDDEPVAADADDDSDAADDGEEGAGSGRRRRRRGGKGRRARAAGEQGDGDGDDEAVAQEADVEQPADDAAEADEDGSEGSSRRRRRRRSRGGSGAADTDGLSPRARRARDEVVGVKGSTRLEAKKQRRREGREAGRRRTIISEAEFLARREAVERVMVVKESHDHTQIGVLEDGVLVEHYISSQESSTAVGNIYLGRVQNVLPSMEAAFIDIGKGRNAVLYAGEVNWDAQGIGNGQARRIEDALKSGGSVLVQVTKDPIGHKGARLTSQISLPGRYLVYVPNSSMTGISRKLPDTERSRLKRILKEVVPSDGGVIVRTAAEGASEEELRADVERLVKLWEKIQAKAKNGHAPSLLHGEADMTVRVIRDIFNEDFSKLVVAGGNAYDDARSYVESVAPDLAERVEKWVGPEDLFAKYRVDEALTKAMDRKVWLPSGGSLIIDRTEAMTVIDVNTGKFVGAGGNLEETVTRNNLEAAEEIVRQLRLRDIGGIIVVDFIDMVLESNRDLVVRRLVECLGRDRTKHQVAEVTSLGLVQMTRKRVGAGLIEVFSESCTHCNGRGLIVSMNPVGTKPSPEPAAEAPAAEGGGRRKARRGAKPATNVPPTSVRTIEPPKSGPTAAQIAAAAHAAAQIAAMPVEADADTEHPVDAPAPAGDQPLPSPDPVAAPSVDAAPETGAAQAGDQVEPEAAAQAPQAAGPASVEELASAAPEETTEPPAAAQKRRRRARVVAPAGPPRPADEPSSQA